MGFKPTSLIFWVRTLTIRPEEVQVGLEKDSIQITLEEMKEAAVDQDQVQEQVQIEIESDALSVGGLMILPKTVSL